MSNRPEIDIFDDEFCTPVQRAEMRRMKAELPLWQEMEAQPDGTPQVTQGDGSNTWAQWLADVELHRMKNGTVGMESEE